MPDISFTRLQNQQITQSEFQSPKTLLSWFGAMQAQDYEMTKWALGVRLPGTKRYDIEKAIDEGSIIRTHLLRPTWHFVAAEDIRWMMDLTAPRIRMGIRSRHKSLGLTKDIISTSNKIIERALSEKKEMTRKDLVEELEKAGFKNEDNLASHLLITAELEKIICSGPTKKNETLMPSLKNEFLPLQV